MALSVIAETSSTFFMMFFLLRAASLSKKVIRCQGKVTGLSPQNDNVLFAQSRNVLLTAPSLGDARRTTTDDTSRTGPPGGPEEGEEEADHAEGGGGRAGNHGKEFLTHYTSFCRKTHKTLIPRQLCRASGVGMPTLPSPARPPLFRQPRFPEIATAVISAHGVVQAPLVSPPVQSRPLAVPAPRTERSSTACCRFIFMKEIWL